MLRANLSCETYESLEPAKPGKTEARINESSLIGLPLRIRNEPDSGKSGGDLAPAINKYGLTCRQHWGSAKLSLTEILY
jgi:hypothetical protein